MTTGLRLADRPIVGEFSNVLRNAIAGPREAGSVAAIDTPEMTSGSSPLSVTVTSWPGPIVSTVCVGNTGVFAAKAGPGPALGTICTVFVAVIGSSDSSPV